MTLRLLCAVLVDRAVTTADTIARPVDLNSQIFRYLDSKEREEAASVSKRDDQIERREYARLDASIVAPNRIEVQTTRVQRHSLFLNEQLIDPSTPLVLLTNRQVSFEGLVTPSIETLLRQARLRQDPQHLFSIHLAVQVRKQP